jgi:hypothetical protein
MWHLICSIIYSVVLINSSLLTITLSSLVITMLIYNNTEYSARLNVITDFNCMYKSKCATHSWKLLFSHVLLELFILDAVICHFQGLTSRQGIWCDRSLVTSGLQNTFLIFCLFVCLCCILLDDDHCCTLCLARFYWRNGAWCNKSNFVSEHSKSL